jgi:probable rRNA maturation factor
MEIDVEIANDTQGKINKRLVKAAVSNVLRGEMGDERPVIVEVSIASVSPQKIKALNKKWRKVDGVTDVLSFCEEDFLKRYAAKKLMPREFLGDLIICLVQVAKDAKELQKTQDQELSWVVAHGILHLLGYDHETSDKDALAMRQREKFYLDDKI